MAAEPITLGYVTGKTVTVSIRRDADGFFLDFADLTFKGSGWTTINGPLTADATKTDFYRRTVDPASWSQGIYQALFYDAAAAGRIISSRETAVVILNATGSFTADLAVGQVVLSETVPGGYPTGSAGEKLGRIGTGQITVSAPVASTGRLALIHGDDYFNADGRALEWTSSGWPDLTSAVNIKVTMFGTTFTGSAVTVGAGSQKVRLELTAAQTGSLALATGAYDVQATLVSSHIVTLVKDYVSVAPDVTP